MAVLDKYNILLEKKAFCTARVHPHANSQSEQVSLASWLYEHGCILVLFILRVDIQKHGFCLDILHFFVFWNCVKLIFTGRFGQELSEDGGSTSIDILQFR